jgi:Bacterial Ig domain
MDGLVIRRGMRTGVVAVFAAAACFAVPSSAAADACGATDGPSLTTSLADANCDFIALAAGTYTSASGFTAPARTVSISGPGASSATITRSGAGNVFTVPTGATLGLSGVTLSGATNGAGMGVSGTGVATLSNSAVTANTSTASGGGIAFSGLTLTVADTVISGNSTTGNGGGVENSGPGTATFQQVLFTQNISTGSGGGGAADASAALGTTNFKNVTFTANQADADGGAVRSATAGATTSLNNATIAGNIADHNNTGGGDAGGGISNTGGTVNVGNSIVANNTATGGGAPDCDSAVGSPLTRTGYELIRDATGCTFGVGDSTSGYQTGVNPLLGALAGNGGTLQTMTLLPGSPAVNAGNPATPTGTGGTCELIDQRHSVRTSAAVVPCDLGAIEVQPAICHSFSRSTGMGVVAPITLDCNGDPFLYSIAANPSHGSLSGFNSTTGSVTYTPAGGFSGTDAFTYRGVNGPVGSSIATVILSVKGSVSPTPNAPGAPGAGFNLKAAIKHCKARTPKGPKRTRCIKKAKKRARAAGRR